MDYSEEDFMEEINKSFEAYNNKGARSNAKLKPVHSFIANYLYEKLDRNYRIYSQGFQEDKEYTIEGKYYRKREDIVVLDPDHDPIIAISFK